MKSATAGASTAFIALGAAAAVGIVKAIDATVTLAREVKGLQNVTSQTAESASALIAVGNLFGVTVDKLSVAFGILEKNIGTNNKALASYGLNLHDAKGDLLPFDQQLGVVADKFNALPDSAAKAAFGTAAFGKSWKTVVPILKLGSDGIAAQAEEAKKLGVVLSQDTVNKALELSRAEREFGESLKGAAVSIGTAFLPQAKQLVVWVTGAVEWFTKLSPALKTTVLDLALLTGGLAAVVKVAEFFINTWEQVLASITGSAVEAAAATAAAGVQAAATEALNVSMQRLTATMVLLSEGYLATNAQVDAYIAFAPGVVSANTAVAGSLDGVAAAAARVNTAASTGLLGKLFGLAGPASIAGAAGLPAASFLAGGVGIGGQKQLTGQDVADLALRGSLPGGAESSRAMALAAGANAKAYDLAASSGISYAEAVDRLSATATRAIAVLNGTSAALAGLDFSALLADTPKAADAIGQFVGRARPAMENFAQVSGQSIDTIKGDFAKLRDLTKATAGDVIKTLIDMKAAWQAWHDQLVSNFGGAEGALSAFEGKNKVSFGKLTSSLQGYIGKLHQFRDDFRTLGRDPASKEFLRSASEGGLKWLGILNSVTAQTPKARAKFFELFNSANTQTDALATLIQRKLVPRFDDMITRLTSIANALGANFKVKIDTTEGMRKLKRLQEQIAATLGQATRFTDTSGDPFHPPHPPPGRGGEHGAFIPGAAQGAFINHEQLFRVGEHHKPEVILPLTDPAGHRQLVAALRDAVPRQGALRAVEGRFTIDDRGQAWFRGLAREEIDDQSTHDRNLASMR